MNTTTKRKTPRDTTEFEREQLRYLLSTDDLSVTLADVNPSLSWLPILQEMKLIQSSTQLAPWVERNFGEIDAIKDVASNIHFFSPEAAELLESRLNRQADRLQPLLVKCWRLIIRAIRSGNRKALRNEWFDIAPRVKRGEQAPELVNRLAAVLTPKLRIRERLAWHDDENRGAPQRPTDLMSIDYEIDQAVSENEVLSAWPSDAPAEADERLLRALSVAVSTTLEDAIDVGVESNTTFSISDTDVPSVADHRQNAYRTGFLPIVRLIADVWTRLAAKDRMLALPLVESWRTSRYRLVRRLALYAAADTTVPSSTAAQVLATIPQGELFLTNSTVEVHRLARARWRDFPAPAAEAIQARIVAGPPGDWFRDEAEVERNVDRTRFDLLGDLERNEVELSAVARTTLAEIRNRWPQWQLRPPEQAGFRIWHEGPRSITGNPGKFQGVSDDLLISSAKGAAETAGLMEGDAWQALCQSDPERALRGLTLEAKRGQWPAWAWDPFLWAAPRLEGSENVAQVAAVLLQSPPAQFSQIAEAASYWLNEKAGELGDDLLWPLWDQIEQVIPRDDAVGQMRDALTSLAKLARGPSSRNSYEKAYKRAQRRRDAGSHARTLRQVTRGKRNCWISRASSCRGGGIVSLRESGNLDVRASHTSVSMVFARRTGRMVCAEIRKLHWIAEALSSNERFVPGAVRSQRRPGGRSRGLRRMVGSDHDLQPTSPERLPNHKAGGAIRVAARWLRGIGQRRPSACRRDGGRRTPRKSRRCGAVWWARFSKVFGRSTPNFNRHPIPSSLSKFCLERAMRFQKPPMLLSLSPELRTPSITRACFLSRRPTNSSIRRHPKGCLIS